MPVDKFSISLPEDLVVDVDDLAQLDGRTRSAIIREATTDYVTKRKRTTRSAQRRERIGSAIDAFKGISAEWGPDERSVTEILDEIRRGSEPVGE